VRSSARRLPQRRLGIALPFYAPLLLILRAERVVDEPDTPVPVVAQSGCRERSNSTTDGLGRAYVEMTQVAVFQAAQPQPQQQQPQASAAGSTRTRSSRSSGCGLRLPTGRSAIRPQAAAWIASPTASAGEEGSVSEATLLASASRSPGRGVFRSPRKPSPVTEASRPGIKSARS
jgi:hypothetical protein